MVTAFWKTSFSVVHSLTAREHYCWAAYYAYLLAHSQDLLIWRTRGNINVALWIGAARKLLLFVMEVTKLMIVFLSVSMWLVNSCREVDASFPKTPNLQPEFGICTHQQENLFRGIVCFTGEAFLLPVGAVMLQKHNLSWWLTQLYAFSSFQHGIHKDEFGLETGDLLCKEKLLLHTGLEKGDVLCKENLLLHTHCTVVSHQVIVRGIGHFTLMESHIGTDLSGTSSKPQCIQLWVLCQKHLNINIKAETYLYGILSAVYGSCSCTDEDEAHLPHYCQMKISLVRKKKRHQIKF